jgi:hypothetical protein
MQIFVFHYMHCSDLQKVHLGHHILSQYP